MRRLLAGHGMVVALGIVCGATSALGSLIPIAVVVGLVGLWVMLRHPSLAAWLVFVGILLAERGVMSAQVFGLPITLSKLAVLVAVVVHMLQVGVLRRPMWEPMATSSGMALVLLSMSLSVVHAAMPSVGFEPIASLSMLVLMAHLLYTIVPRHELPWLFRLMVISTLLVIVWTLFTQRYESFFVTLDHAWSQRTSGAFGDPNLWGACMIVVCPMMIGAMARDDHWLGTPLLVGMLVLFPLAVLQSMSRAALLGFVVISPGLLVLVWHRRSMIGVALLVALVTLPFVVNTDALMLRYQTLVDPTLEASLGHDSLSERKMLLEAGIEIIKDHWLGGVGVGMFPMYAAYTSGGQVWKVAHNSYITVFSEQGLPGVIAHGFFALQAARAAWASWLRPHSPRARSIGLGFLLGLVGFAVIAVTLNLAAFAMFWYTLAIGLAFARLTEEEEAAPPARIAAADEASRWQEAVA